MMTFDDLYLDLLAVVSEAYARPDVPIESEQFFAKFVEDFKGPPEECIAYIKEHLKDWFQHSGKPPVWIQDAEWQFSGGQPMLFIGQSDVSRTSGLFHDDASFYTFYSPETGELKTIIQIS